MALKLQWTSSFTIFVSIPALALAFATILQMCALIHGQANGSSHYCSRDGSLKVQEISGETEGNIFTRYENDDFYHNNQNCVWLIDAGPNNRVDITVVSSDIQWAPESAICPGYDHVAIKDVNSSRSSIQGEDDGGEESIVLQWCGPRKPLGAISSGRFLRVEFMSDNNNPYRYRGVHLTFKTFSANDCAPSWHTSPSNYCFKMLDKETDWSSAQRECNAEHANLASVTSQSEHDFLVQTFRGRRGLTAWIGLSDIVEVGNYQWIDDKEFSFDKFPSDQAPNQYTRCVALYFSDGVWKIHDCEEFKTRPLCKSNKGRETMLFAVPQEKEEDNKVPVGMVAGIIVAVVALLCLITLGICCFRRGKKTQNRSHYIATASQPSNPPRDAGSGNRGETRLSMHLRGAGDATDRARPSAPSAPSVESRGTQIADEEMPSRSPPSYEEVIAESAHPIPFKTFV